MTDDTNQGGAMIGNAISSERANYHLLEDYGMTHISEECK
jgi:hypothetical protein